MSSSIAGHCGKCGAPYFLPTVWHGITPPSPSPSCSCWSSPTVVLTNNTVFQVDHVVDSTLNKEAIEDQIHVDNIREFINKTISERTEEFIQRVREHPEEIFDFDMVIAKIKELGGRGYGSIYLAELLKECVRKIK